MSDFPNDPGFPPDKDNPFEAPQSKADKFADDGTRRDALRKLGPPAVTMLILAILAALWSLASPFLSSITTDAMTEWMMNLMPDEESKERFKDQMEQQQNNPMQPIMTWGFAGLGLIASIVTIYGSIKMKSASSWGWAMAASILTMISNICCLIGIPVGIWALIVLVNADVKKAFH